MSADEITGEWIDIVEEPDEAYWLFCYQQQADEDWWVIVDDHEEHYSENFREVIHARDSVMCNLEEWR